MSGDQKMMLALGGIALLGLLAWWGMQQMSPRQAAATLDVTHQGMGLLLTGLLVFAGVVLSVLAILLPLFIYWIHRDVKKMREIAERNQSRIEQMRVDFSAVRQRWEA